MAKRASSSPYTGWGLGLGNAGADDDLHHWSSGSGSWFDSDLNLGDGAPPSCFGIQWHTDSAKRGSGSDSVPRDAHGCQEPWLDADVVPDRTYFYWLENIDVNGTATQHGPVSVTLPPVKQQYKAFLPLVLK